MSASEFWVDKKLLANLFGCSEKTIENMGNDTRLKWRRSRKRLKNGKLQREYSSLSLSPEMQSKLILSCPGDALALKTEEGQSQLFDARPQARHLTEEQQRLVEDRINLLAPMVDFREGCLKPFCLGEGREVRNMDDVAGWIAAQRQLSKSYVWRLYSRYLRGGAGALEPKGTRADRGQSRAFKNRPALQRFVIGKWNEGINLSHIEDCVKREWGGPLLPYKGKSTPPCYDSINNFIQTIPEAVRDAKRLPKQKWEAKHAPYLVTRRGANTLPNQVWVADHRIYDVIVLNDSFQQAKQNAAVRLWETCIQDMRTRVIVGSVWNISPSWRTIASALRQGISHFGMPELFYCDNGKDFRKVGAGAKRGSLLTAADSTSPVELDDEGRVPGNDGLLARLGIKVCYCTPRHPQSKQIESYFGYVSGRFDQMFKERGYTGSKPDLRPDFCRVAEKQHAQFLAGKRDTSPLFSASEFISLHRRWLEERNSSQHHWGCGMDGRTPLQIMDELLPLAQRTIPKIEMLAHLFWDVQERIVANCKVQLNNSTYSVALDDPEGQQKMYLSNGSAVAVHCDPNDLSCALAFESVPGGALLARMVSDELAAQRPVTQEDVKAVTAQRARLRAASKRVMEIGGSSVPTELDLLARRGGIHHIPAAASPSSRRQVAAAPQFVEDFLQIREAK